MTNTETFRWSRNKEYETSECSVLNEYIECIPPSKTQGSLWKGSGMSKRQRTTGKLSSGQSRSLCRAELQGLCQPKPDQIPACRGDTGMRSHLLAKELLREEAPALRAASKKLTMLQWKTTHLRLCGQPQHGMGHKVVGKGRENGSGKS